MRSVVIAFAVCLLAVPLQAAEILRANWKFTVPVADKPIAISYDQSNNGTFAVLYGDTGRVRFFSLDGTEVASYLPNLSSSGYTNPRLADIVNFDNNGQVLGLLGNPTSSVSGTTCKACNVYQGSLIQTWNISFSDCVSANTKISRWEAYVDPPHVSMTLPATFLNAAGDTVILMGDSLSLSLTTRGITKAQSVSMRWTDANPVVLHDNMLTVLQRKREYPRGTTFQPPPFDVPLSDVGKTLADYSITGLPANASLVDVCCVYCWDDPNFVYNDSYFVLDQATGGVYLLTPEPAALTLLALGVGLILRRRRNGNAS